MANPSEKAVTIDDLPDEVLAEILIHATSPYSMIGHPPRLTFPILRTCRRWMIVGLATPKMWTRQPCGITKP